MSPPYRPIRQTMLESGCPSWCRTSQVPSPRGGAGPLLRYAKTGTVPKIVLPRWLSAAANWTLYCAARDLLIRSGGEAARTSRPIERCPLPGPGDRLTAGAPLLGCPVCRVHVDWNMVLRFSDSTAESCGGQKALSRNALGAGTLPASTHRGGKLPRPRRGQNTPPRIKAVGDRSRKETTAKAPDRQAVTIRKRPG